MNNYILVPKVDENWKVQSGPILDAIRCQSMLEIQMLKDKQAQSLSGSYIKQYTKILPLIHQLKDEANLKKLVLHLPIGSHDIEYIINNQWLRVQIDEFINKCDDLAASYNLEIYILFHIIDNYDKCKGFGVLYFLHYTLDRTSNIRILLENSIRDVRMNINQQTSLDKLFDDIQHPRLGACLDICHLQASENIFKRQISLQESFISNLKTIHFSYTANGDGYIDKKNTHGISHPDDLTFIQDLKYIESKGINNRELPLVLEVSEVDYVARDRLKQEIDIGQRVLRDIK